MQVIPPTLSVAAKPIRSIRPVRCSIGIPGQIVMDHMAAESLEIHALNHDFAAHKVVRQRSSGPVMRIGIMGRSSSGRPMWAGISEAHRSE